MDRRQRKTSEAIFQAFTGLLSQKDYTRITVGEIIQQADVGRATFYAHFETKEFLLREFCRELFCHVLDAACGTRHRHIFDCEGTEDVFLHLLIHLQRNDNNILALLNSPNNALFLQYFARELSGMVEQLLPRLENRRPEGLPDSFWQEHITATFVQTLQWWLQNGQKESPQRICQYFFAVL